MLTIGEQLKQARETKKLTIKQVVQAIQVRSYYLQAMETDDFTALPSHAQARGFLRSYAEYLKLDADQLVEQLRTDTTPDAPHPVQPQIVQPAPPAPIRKPAPEPVESTHKFSIAKPEPSKYTPPAEIELAPADLIPGSSQHIFAEIGSILRIRRELISLTLEEVERHTHVRRHNLEMIEAGEFDKLASPVQLRGTLSAYASFLDLDPDIILLRYADAIQARRLEMRQADPIKSPKQTRRAHEKKIALPGWLRGFFSPDLIFGGSMILILLGLSIWGAQRIFTGTSSPTNPTQGPSISDVLLATSIVTPTSADNISKTIIDDSTALPTRDPALPTPGSNVTSGPTTSSAVQVTVEILERTLLRVSVDGEVKQDGRVSSGAALTFEGSSRIEVLTGSGSAVRIIFNPSDLGVMGNLGEVVYRIYTVNGVETPTPTPSSTPTITPTPTRTIRPSPTKEFTPTRKPTLTTTPVP